MDTKTTLYTIYCYYGYQNNTLYHILLLWIPKQYGIPYTVTMDTKTKCSTVTMDTKTIWYTIYCYYGYQNNTLYHILLLWIPKQNVLLLLWIPKQQFLLKHVSDFNLIFHFGKHTYSTG
jgi:hypothetical protein